MAETTGISWCDATINFWHGCQKVSEGCKYCYMFRDKEKYGQVGSEVKRTQAKTIARILLDLHKQRAERIKAGNFEPLKIFTCSWSDFFLDVPFEWLEAAWDIIRKNKEFVWIILTKRPERIPDCLPLDWGEGYKNVWLLVSTENQQRFDERVALLLKVPAKVRGVSMEPLLGRIDISKRVQDLDWIIIGGESGNDTGIWKYRPAAVAWFIIAAGVAKSAGKAVWIKQMGTYISKFFRLKDRTGENMDEWPKWMEALKIREFPN
jgi:protein gp37